MGRVVNVCTIECEELRTGFSRAGAGREDTGSTTKPRRCILLVLFFPVDEQK